MDVSDENSAQSSEHLFLSYASSDRELALEIAEALEAAGTPVWIDRRGISGGDLWASEIATAIRNCTALVLLCTDASMRSRNIRQEVQLAWDHDRPIVPLVAQPIEFPDQIAYFLQGRQWIELGAPGNQEWVASISQAITSPHAAVRSQSASARSMWSETNLPIPPSDIVGRESQISETLAVLADQKTRLITLAGPGGVGKTRIALDVTWRHRNQSGKVVQFANLAPVEIHTWCFRLLPVCWE